MPRKIYRFGDFSGGLNTNSDKYTVKQNELAESIDAVIGVNGVVTLAGKLTASDEVTTHATTVVPSHGFFIYKSDYAPHTDTNVSTELYVLQNGANVDIYDKTNTTWKSAEIDIGTVGTSVYPSYYVADGILRVCDGNYLATHIAGNEPHWYGYIDNTHFSGLTPGGSADTYTQFYDKVTAITPPTAGLVGDIRDYDDGGGNTTTIHYTDKFIPYDSITNQFAVSTFPATAIGYAISGFTDDTLTTSLAPDWDSLPFALYPSAGKGFNVDCVAGGTGGYGIPETYEFASSFIYDGIQESLLFQMEGTVDIESGQTFECIVHTTAPFDPRITGGRIYNRIKDSGGDWVLLLDISLSDGIRSSMSGTYDSWSYLENGTSVFVHNSGSPISVDGNSSVTYQMLSGLDPEETTIAARWKTACVINRRVYIGNVYQDGRQYADRMVKSEYGKFDTFPMSNYVDVAIGDGDEIIKLVAYGDRILQFKKNRLYIINVSQDYEFIEAVYENRGVDYQSCVSVTPYGIAFVNKFGCFIYDGNKVVEIGNKISDDIRDTFYVSASTNLPSIGYSPVDDSLILYSTTADEVIGFIYRFEFKNANWSLITATNLGDTKTNFAVNENGKLLMLDNNDDLFYEWKNTPAASGDFDFKTGMSDFGFAGSLKRISAVTIVYYSNATTNVKLGIYTDDGSVTYLNSGNALANTGGKWTRTRYEVSLDNVSLVQLRLTDNGSDVTSTLKVGAIEVEYRIFGVGYGS